MGIAINRCFGQPPFIWRAQQGFAIWKTDDVSDGFPFEQIPSSGVDIDHRAFMLTFICREISHLHVMENESFSQFGVSFKSLGNKASGNKFQRSHFATPPERNISMQS